jgi:hypothetical protein
VCLQVVRLAAVVEPFGRVHRRARFLCPTECTQNFSTIQTLFAPVRTCKAA